MGRQVSTRWRNFGGGGFELEETRHQLLSVRGKLTQARTQTEEDKDEEDKDENNG